MARMIRDPRTGRTRTVNQKLSTIAKRAAAKRRGKKLSAQHKAAIRKGVNKALRSGRTRFGRKVVKSR